MCCTWGLIEITLADRYFTNSPNSFQQSIEYAGKTGSKLNFTYTIQTGICKRCIYKKF